MSWFALSCAVLKPQYMLIGRESDWNLWIQTALMSKSYSYKNILLPISLSWEMGRTLFYYIFHHYTRTNTISTFSSLSFIFSCVNAQSSTALGWMYWMPGSKDNTSHYTITGSMKAYDLSSNPVKKQAGKADWQRAACSSITHYAVRENMKVKTIRMVKQPYK